MCEHILLLNSTLTIYFSKYLLTTDAYTHTHSLHTAIKWHSNDVSFIEVQLWAERPSEIVLSCGIVSEMRADLLKYLKSNMFTVFRI
jgi:hypothetical protein